MCKRFAAIWFRYLKTDWIIRHHPHLKNIPFVLSLPDHGRIRITEVSAIAKTHGIQTGMVVADAKVILPSLHVIDDTPGLSAKLLEKIALWCIRYTPIASVDLPDGLILDVSGCTHLWGSEEDYLKDLTNKLKSFGYHIRAAMADTIGAAWAVSRFGKVKAIIKSAEQLEALMQLPPAALRLDIRILERLQKLGLYQISSFINMPYSALRRRFGEQLLLRLYYALGNKEEFVEPIIPIEPYSERLPCLEPIQTSTGIEIALQKLLDALCKRLQKEDKGLRIAILKCYRVDNKIECASISPNHPSYNIQHLFKLFEQKICLIEPALGIELFTLEALKVEDITPLQETLWTANSNLESKELSELLDRIESKFGNEVVHRYLPDEHHLPERSIKLATSLKEKQTISWRDDKPRPMQLLKEPQAIAVTAPIPDYPPMNFRYNSTLHKIKKADGPERVEPEWWLKQEEYRDYYIVEDEEGKRYWIFRAGHYDAGKNPSWFIHGFFA
jgi:protein ImuB